MRKLTSFGLALFLGAGFVLAEGNAARAQQNEVRGFYDTLLTTMKNGRSLGQSGRCAVPPVDDPSQLPESSRAPRAGLRLMIIIVVALALVAVYANVQKARRDKIEKVTIIPVSPAASASPSPTD